MFIQAKADVGTFFSKHVAMFLKVVLVLSFHRIEFKLGHKT